MRSTRLEAMVFGAVLVFGAALVASAAPAAGQRGGVAAAIVGFERELAADVARDSVGSISAAVFDGREVIWRGAFGWSDRASGRLATPASLYRAGSISKTVTALVLLRLVESGVVSLGGPVAEHLPEVRRLAGAASHPRGISFYELATHTAGLAREPEREVFGRGKFMDWKRQLVAAIPETRLLDPPGLRYRYSNIGYALLGFALERAAERPFEVLADSLVFRPLGMRSASLLVPDDHLPRLATGYVNLDGDAADPRVPRAEHRGRGYRVPNGGVYAAVDDLARLGMALTGALPLLPDSLRHLMLTDATPRAGRAGYGIGLQLVDLGTTTLAGHSGTTPGYAAYLAVDPEAGTGVVLLRNYNRGGTNLGAIATRLLLDLRGAMAPNGADPRRE